MSQTLPTASELKSHHCVPCEGGTQPLKPAEYAVYLDQVRDWQILNEKALEKEFVFKDFKACLAFTNKIGAIAESEGHHPNIFLHDYKKVRVTLTTFAIGGLSVNDFVMAVKIDEVWTAAK